MKYTLLVAALCMLAATACKKQESLTVVHNVKGYAFENGELKTFSAVVIAGGKFRQVGGEELVSENPGAELVDGLGKTMLPGLIDAHGHVMGLGIKQLNVDLVGINSLEETLAKVKEYADANPDLEWIRGRGWNQTIWPENAFPTAADLDKVIADRPVWLVRVDGHAGWANTKAMEIAGITNETPDPQGGKVIRDRSGKATGIFVDAAEGYIASKIPEYTEKELETALEKALEELASVGITSVHDAGTSIDDWSLFKQFADEGRLTARIYSMISGAGKTFDTLSANGPIDSYANDLLSMRSVKLYSDGALGSRGAALLEDYSDDPGNRGLLFSSQEEMNEMVNKVASKGFQVNIHAIGDRGNRVVLNALENANNSIENSRSLRHRIEHAQIVALEDIPRFKEIGLIASMQPTHATSDMNMAEDRVGPKRILGGYAWQRFLEQGTIVASGSDFPVEFSNPFFGLYSAVTRMDHQQKPEGGWYPDQKMTREQALKSFTIDAAFAAHQENVLGNIEAGKWADFILIDRDFFSADAGTLWDTKVLQTWVAGKPVFSKN